MLISLPLPSSLCCEEKLLTIHSDNNVVNVGNSDKKKILQIHANESCKALWGEYFILVDKSWSWHHVNTQYNNILTFTLIYRCFFILEAVRLQPPPFPLSWSQSQLSSVIHKPHFSQSKRQLIMFLVNTTQRCIIFIIKKLFIISQFYAFHLPLLTIHPFLLVLKDGLSKNFSNVEVEVVDCPDLREKPWTLAAPGMVWT